MARQAAIKIANQFVNGLITENTALSFPEEAALETFDCVFDKSGRVTRRDGFDVEGAAKLTSIPYVAGDTVSEYLWETVNGVAAKSFLVVQTANLLRFYDVSTSTDVTDNVHADTLDLDGYLPVGSTKDPATELCQFTAGNGDLIVVNPACSPFFVTYNADEDEFGVDLINMAYRDLAGVLDGLEVSERPASSLTTLSTANPQHYYNIFNQGWFENPLDQWDTARSDMPSNADIMATTRKDASDSFEAGQVTSNTGFNSTEAPKGHFILDVFAPDRVAACNDEAPNNIVGTAGTDVQLGALLGSIITDLDTDIDKTFSGNYWESGSTSGSVSSIYIGKNFGSSGKQKMARARIYGDITYGFIEGSNPTITATLRGSNTLPTDWVNDGDSLGTDNGTDSSYLDLDITSTDLLTAYQYVWVSVIPSSGTNQMYIGEIVFWAIPSPTGETLDVDDMKTDERPRAVAFYSSRAWYSGIDEKRRSSNIYYSQLIQKDEQFGRCYQQNDPTNEDVFDLVATDGGVLNIPDIGAVKTMFTYQDSLLVLSNLGIWQIKGGASGFAADDFLVRKISSVGISSVRSLIDVKGVPVFWADQGIYSVVYDFENDSFQAKSLTDEKIKSFITDIPEYNRQFVKGVYDVQKELITFLYNDSATLATDVQEGKYTKILNLDTRTGAFYPWTIGANSIIMRGALYIRTADRAVSSVNKYLCFENVDASNEKIGFANQVSGQLLDWTQYAIDVADATEEVDYMSYFETGYLVHAEAIKQFQANYINVFMEVVDTSGLKMKGIFDFSTSASSGKEGTLQQCYNDNGQTNLAFRAVSMKKLKIRGKGKSVSLRFESETERPFTLIGWSIYETANAGL